MRLILVFVLLYFISSCSNEYNSSGKNIDSLKNIESKGNNNSVKIQNFHQIHLYLKYNL